MVGMAVSSYLFASSDVVFESVVSVLLLVDDGLASETLFFELVGESCDCLFFYF